MRLHGQDLQVSEQTERERSQRTALPLDQIQDRASDTRQLRQDHVEQLAESIAVLGLLEPLVVDNQGRLLAGGHRKAAIYHVKESHPEAYEQHFQDDIVPVRMLAFNADDDPEKALQVEISENEKRRDYTPAEVRALADRLRSAGYADTPGRPIKDEKRLRPALEIIIGKSLRSVRRYLTEEKPVQFGQVSKKTALRRAKSALEQWMSVVGNEETTATERQLSKKLPSLLELMEKLIEHN
ncbi:ParB/RepB/Spo0J family partition protein [Trichocoleus sp. FACHB-262]|nr:ParB/RepB/Spo0J family partition protein [Trichocoleus sp. FACHB-262]